MQRYKHFFNYQNKYFYFKFIFAGCFAIYGKQYIFVVPHQPNIALGYCVKFPRCILIYDAGGLFISYSDNTTICKFRRNIRFPILLFVWSLRRTLQMLRTHILTGFHATQIVRMVIGSVAVDMVDTWFVVRVRNESRRN